VKTTASNDLEMVPYTLGNALTQQLNGELQYVVVVVSCFVVVVVTNIIVF